MEFYKNSTSIVMSLIYMLKQCASVFKSKTGMFWGYLGSGDLL